MSIVIVCRKCETPLSIPSITGVSEVLCPICEFEFTPTEEDIQKAKKKGPFDIRAFIKKQKAWFIKGKEVHLRGIPITEERFDRFCQDAFRMTEEEYNKVCKEVS